MSVGRKRNLYIRKRNGIEDDEVECFFDKEVENKFADLSRRVKNEREQFSSITVAELGTLTKFVVLQSVRTLANKECMEEQFAAPLGTRIFVSEMLRQAWAIMRFWGTDPPAFYFWTCLPYVGEHFITGDSPVVILQMNDNLVWMPTDTLTLGIMGLEQILKSPNYSFGIALSPYVSVLLQGHGDGEAHLPPKTRSRRKLGSSMTSCVDRARSSFSREARNLSPNEMLARLSRQALMRQGPTQGHGNDRTSYIPGPAGPNESSPVRRSAFFAEQGRGRRRNRKPKPL